jgi:hypothetical protein
MDIRARSVTHDAGLWHVPQSACKSWAIWHSNARKESRAGILNGQKSHALF